MTELAVNGYRSRPGADRVQPPTTDELVRHAVQNGAGVGERLARGRR